jgi:hypothetical protein
MVLTRDGGIVSFALSMQSRLFVAIATDQGSQLARPTIHHDEKWTLAFRPGHHDFRLRTVVWKWSWLLQRHYLQGYWIRVQRNPVVA